MKHVYILCDVQGQFEGDFRFCGVFKTRALAQKHIKSRIRTADHYAWDVDGDDFRIMQVKVRTK